MKQGIMKKTAILLIITLMAGVLCALATIRVFASPGDDGDLYSDDLREYFLSLKPAQENQINQFFDLLDTALNEDYNYYAAASKNDGDWIISIYGASNLNNKTWYSFSSGSYNGISRQPYVNDTNVNRIAYLYYNGTLTFDFSNANKYTTINQGFWVSPSYAGYCIYPSTYNNNSYDMFSSRDIGSGNGGFTFSANFFAGSPEPEILPFTMVQFQIGDRHFITLQDQSLFANFDPVTEDGEYFWELKYNNNFPEDNDAVYPVTILWSMLYRLSADLAQYVPNIQNVGYFLYAYEITDLVQSGVYFTIDSGEIWSVYTTEGGGRTDTLLYQSDSALTFNSPYEPEEPSQQDQAWVNYTNYYNTYNTTHVIAEQLNEFLSGSEGLNVYPAYLQVPSMFMDQNGNVPQYTSGIRYFTWHYSPDFDTPGINFDLMDVCIIGLDESHSENDEVWRIFYFKDSTLNFPRDELFKYSWDQIIEAFDIVLVVPEIFNGVTYDMDPFWYHNSSGISQIQGFCGSGSQGITYGSFENNFNVYHCYSFVTKKALQKQMLFNFNDGITKTYQLMCDFIDKRGDWDDSFLLWSASIFQQLDSCNGKLNDIKNAIIDLNAVVNAIKDAVNKIALDPDPDNTSPWYLSLWNFINQFEPSNDQISDAIDLLDDNLDDIPLLPALTPVPALPTLGG